MPPLPFLVRPVHPPVAQLHVPPPRLIDNRPLTCSHWALAVRGCSIRVRCRLRHSLAVREAANRDPKLHPGGEMDKYGLQGRDILTRREERFEGSEAARTPGTAMVRSLLFLCVLTALFFAAGAPRAEAGQTRLFLENFGSAAQPTFTRVIALATDQGSGSVLAYDGAAGTVSRFNSDGTPNDFSSLGTNVIGGLETAGAAGYPGEVGLAMDESGTSTDGNIYVAQRQAHVVKVFSENGESLGQITAAGSESFAGALSPCGVVVGPGGELYVGAGGQGGTLSKYEPSGSVPVNSDYVASESFPAPFPCNLALGSGPSAGSIFSAYGAGGKAFKYDLASGSLAYRFGTESATGEPPQTLTVDPTNGHALLSEPKSASNVTEYDVSGSAPVTVASFDGSFLALAVDAATGRVIAAKDAPGGGETGTLEVYSQIVPLPDVVTGVAAPLSPISLRFNGTVNPVGAPVTECVFEYGLTEAYGATAPCESPNAAELGTGNAPLAVHADVSALAPESTYHFRLVAKNANGVVVGSDSLTKTPSKPTIGLQWASNVGTSDATVNANITPENSATTFKVEWGETAAYGQTTPSEPIAGVDLAVHVASAPLTGLLPGRVYHYRFVAENAQGTDVGVDRAFTTFKAVGIPPLCANESLRSPASIALPECRAYELVSPVDKANGDVMPLKNISGWSLKLAQVAPDGNSLAYSAFRAFPGSTTAPYTSEYIARRGPTGWTSEALAPPEDSLGPFNVFANTNNNFKAFTPDLCSVWFVRGAPPALAPGAVPGFGNLYRRNSCGPTPQFEALTTVTPPGFVPHELGLEELPELLGFSNDGATTVFRLPWKLTSDGLETIEGKPAFQTYEVRNGVLSFVCILPSGNPVKEHCTAGIGPFGAGSRARTPSSSTWARACRMLFPKTVRGSTGRQPGTFLLARPGKSTCASTERKPSRYRARSRPRPRGSWGPPRWVRGAVPGNGRAKRREPLQVLTRGAKLYGNSRRRVRCGRHER